MYLLLCLLAGISISTAQTMKVTGTVVSSEDGEPIIGATVLVKGTTNGTITDVNGSFSLNADKNAMLRISYVGMNSVDAPAQQRMRITLSSAAEQIDEVVVVAYGTAKKSSFTGSAAVVNAEALDKRVLTNAAQALEGQASGVQVTSSSGQPGSAPSIRIRGFGSINSSNAPLYVVDGTIYNGEISDINSNDIESMTVLKDAASTSLYGSSAGNGVILITTKTAKKEGQNSITLNVSQGFSQRAIKEYSRVNAWQYYPLQWQMLKNQYISSGKYTAAEAAQGATADIYSQLKYNPFKGVANDAIVDNNGNLNSAATSLLWGDDLDWAGAAYRTGSRSEYNLSYSTKTDKSDSYASVGYLKEHGYMIRTDMDRFSGRVNYNIYPVKWFKTGLNLGATRTKSNISSSTSDNTNSYGNLVRFVRVMAPIYPIHVHDMSTGAYLDESGQPTTDASKYVYDYNGGRLSDTGRHGIAEAYWNNRLNERDAYNAHTYIELTLMDGLKVTSNASLESSDLHRKVYENTKVGDGSPAGRLNNLSTRNSTYTFNQLVTYAKKFGDHSFDVLLGHENYSYKYQYMYGMRESEIVAGVYELSNFTKIDELDSYTDRYKKEGYFFRGNYNYLDKYYGSLSYRHDGSSRFSKDSRWGDFWSFGASWRISQENFMKDLKWVNNLKLRASYGETGNDALLDDDLNDVWYAYQTLYYNGMNNAGEGGIFFQSFGNKDLKWETQVSSDLALEFGLFDRLTGSIEYFQKNSKDLLFSVPTPTSSGVTSIWKNLGKVKNNGVEINLDYQAFKNKDWTVSVGANATFVSNTVKSLPEGQSEIISGTKKISVGHSMYDFWLKEYYGVDPDNGSALYVFDDGETNGVANQTWDDKTCIDKNGKKLTYDQSKAKYHYCGSSIPDVFGGFNFNVKYRAFELNGVFSYAIGGKIYDGNYRNLMTNQYGYAMSKDVMKAWKQAGDITDVPRLDQSQATNFDAVSDRWLVKSDYLSLRTLTLAYSLPKTLISTIGVKNCRLSVSGENLFQLNHRQGLNSQANYSGVSYNEYNPARTVTFNLNITL